MPVLLHADEQDRWLDGSFNEAGGFQRRCFPGHLIATEQTAEPWVKHKAPTEAIEPII